MNRTYLVFLFRLGKRLTNANHISQKFRDCMKTFRQYDIRFLAVNKTILISVSSHSSPLESEIRNVFFSIWLKVILYKINQNTKYYSLVKTKIDAKKVILAFLEVKPEQETKDLNKETDKTVAMNLNRNKILKTRLSYLLVKKLQRGSWARVLGLNLKFLLFFSIRNCSVIVTVVSGYVSGWWQ